MMPRRILQMIDRTADRFFQAVEGDDSRKFWFGFAAILGLGLILRFWNLGAAPIWADEGATLGLSRLDWSTILFAGVDNHPPLSYLIQKAWMSLVPDTGLARVPSAVAGAASIAVIMLMARDLFSYRIALMAGLLFALSTGHVYFSQDARMYPWLVLGLCIAMWGAIGHNAPGRLSGRAYAGLYILGGFIAIYSQIIGLVGMGVIGLASLAVGLMSSERIEFARDWLVRNLILLVLVLPWLVQIPSFFGSFPGLNASDSLMDGQWMYRNVTGFPGLGGLSLPFELFLFGAASLAVVLAWLHQKRALSLTILGLVFLYPALLAVLHTQTPMFANRVFLPSIVGVSLGAAYTLASLRWRTAGLTGLVVLSLAAASSTQFEMRHRVKTEDFPAALRAAEAQGFSSAAVLTCNQFTTAAAWENAPGTPLYYSKAGDIIDYQGPYYWHAAERGMVSLRQISIEEIDNYLGGGWRVEGGLAEVAAEYDEILFYVRVCNAGESEENAIRAELAELGFQQVGTRQTVGEAAPFIILEQPLSWVEFYRRSDAGAAAAP